MAVGVYGDRRWTRGSTLCLIGVRLLVAFVVAASSLQLHFIGFAESAFAGFYFSTEPSDLVVSSGASAILDCHVHSNDLSSAPEIQWIKDGAELPFDSRKNILSNGSLHFMTAEYTPAHRPDEGVYQCRATIKGLGTIVSRKARLQISYGEVNFVEEPRGMMLHVGDIAMIPCSVADLVQPVIRWFKYDEKLDPGNGRYHFHDDGVLEILSLQSSDFGNYKCQVEVEKKAVFSGVAHLALDDNRATYHKVPPRFVMKPKDRVAIEGSTVVLHCGANGRDRNGAQPQISWLKDGSTLDGLLEPENRLSLVGAGSLKIRRISEDDSGLYTCRATNMEESIDADVTVTVQVPPKILAAPASAVGQVSADVELVCSVHGVPKPSVHWLKNGDAVIPSDYFQLVDGYNLRILGLVLSDAGMYQCIASNAVGSAQSTAQLVVREMELMPDLSEQLSESVTEDPGHHTVGVVIVSNTTGVPFAPSDLQVVLMSMRFVTLSWAAPAHSGLSDVAGYSVFWKEDLSDRERVLNTSALEANIQHLKPSTKYHFRVVAWNSQGPSAESAQITMDMQPEAMVPDAPRNLQAVTLSPTSVRVSWDSPVNTNGPIVTFKVHYYCPGDVLGENDINVLENDYTFTELQKFQTYVFRVVAYNANGPGVATDDVSSRTYSDVPSQPPQNVSVESASSTSIVVRWEPPSDDAVNGIITGYKIRYKQRGDKAGETVTTDGVRRMYDLTDLQKGTEYSIRIQAMNSNGSGPASPWIPVETFLNDLDESVVPGQPTWLRVRPQTNSIVVSWSPPQEQTIMIRGYIIGYGIGIPDVFQQILDAKQRSHTIKGLKASYEYVISLKAFNNIGEGRPVYENIQTKDETSGSLMHSYRNAPEPLTPMLPPVGVKANVLSATTIVLTWTDTTLGRNQHVTDNRHYVIRYNPKLSRKPKIVNATDLNLYLEDLKPDTEYEFSIKVVKGQRQSTWSLSVFNKTRESAPTTAPRDLTVVQIQDQPTWASLSWQPPRQMNGQVTGYLVFYTTDATLSDREWVVEGVSGGQIATTIRDLTSQTTYYFKVQARNTMGYGPMSPTVIFRTPNADGSGGGMLLTNDDVKKTKISKDPVQNSDGVSPMVLWVVIGIVGSVAVISIAVVVAIIFVRRKNGTNTDPPQASTSASKSGRTDLKPPDLWIHDQMEMKRLSRNSVNSSNLSGDMLDGPDDSVSMDLPNGDQFRNRRNPAICPIMIPVDNPPQPRDPLGPLLPNGHMPVSDASYSISGIRPLFPRPQFTNTPRVNAGDIHHQLTDYPMSTLERHRARNDNCRKLLGSNPRLTALEHHPAPPPYHSITSNAWDAPKYSTLSSSPNSSSQRFNLPQCELFSRDDFAISSSVQSNPAFQPDQPIVRPTQLQGHSSNMQNSSSSSATASAIPTSISRGPLSGLPISPCSPDMTIRSNDSSEMPKSFSTEELTAEMANIEGLMKDLTAITQHEFHC